jgi:hypothetical protein
MSVKTPQDMSKAEIYRTKMAKRDMYFGRSEQGVCVNRPRTDEAIIIYTNTVIPVDLDVTADDYADIINPTVWDTLNQNPLKTLYAWSGLTTKSKSNADGSHAVIPFRLHEAGKFPTDRRPEL